MKKIWILTLLVTLLPLNALCQQKQMFPMQGLSVNTPLNAKETDQFCKFIKEELAPMGVNAIFLRVDYNYEFESIPQMRSSHPLTKAEVKKIVETCREAKIEIIPLINMLGHQSWAGKMNRLLELYPEFDENAYIPLPKEGDKQRSSGLYDGDLYCKSYCPLHPDVHNVVFKLIGELIDVFQAKAIHVGMDEVYYIGEYGCPRCSGKNKAKLFADEINKLNSYIRSRGCQTWMWGDRLIDGSRGGASVGNWEGDTIGIHPAIDLISRNVRIADWHYERADMTPVIFATKGYNVAVSPWRKPQVGLKHVDNINMFRSNSPRPVADRYVGIIHTDWGSLADFMNEYQLVKAGKPTKEETAANTFYQVFTKMKQ